MEPSAAEAITGLTITFANYDEAIANLKKRFGNSQLIVEEELSVAAVSSRLDIRGLRKLYDTVEAHVRGLCALGVPAESYGGLLTSVIVNKLPSELRLIVGREMTTEKWEMDGMMKILEQGGSQRACFSLMEIWEPLKRRSLGHQLELHCSPTIRDRSSTCVYCGQGHASTMCTTITDMAARKHIYVRLGSVKSVYEGIISTEIVTHTPVAECVRGGTT